MVSVTTNQYSSACRAERTPQVHVNYLGFSGITVGQAHLLDDLIDQLEMVKEGLLPDDYFARRTFTYALGVEHTLYRLLEKAALVE